MDTAKLTEKLERFLDLMLDGLNKGGEFVAEQAPLVVQELIVWKRAWFAVLAAGCLVAVVVSLKALVFCKRGLDKSSIADEDGYFLGLIFSGILAALATGGFFSAVYWSLMVWLAPRIYVIEYIRGLIGK